MKIIIEFDCSINDFEIEDWLNFLNEKSEIKRAYVENNCKDCEKGCKKDK
jgi:hypothetical protein